MCATGDVLDIMEQRHDWAKFNFTMELFKYVFTVLIPCVISHSQTQDEEQVRDHYDRMSHALACSVSLLTSIAGGDDFYGWFLGPRMIYTSGIIIKPDAEESLEELQDNKLAVVCSKLDLQPEDRLLDIGCGWGTLVAYAAKNYECDATGVTLAKNQAKFGTDRIEKNGVRLLLSKPCVDTLTMFPQVPASRARILCSDYRDIPAGTTYTKIVSLEMAEVCNMSFGYF